MAASATAATLMASNTLLFQNPNSHRPLNLTTHSFRLPQNPSFSRKLQSFSLRPSPKSLRISVSHSSQSPLIKRNSDAIQSTFSDSTRNISFSSILALAASISPAILTTIRNLVEPPTAEDISNLRSLQANLMCNVGPMFFAAIRSRPSGALNTPLTVVAAGLAKWLDIYSGVLMVRVLLSWFPNIPWDRQPLSAIRDLCDPYLNLFRNIIPPIFDVLDVSPLLAFSVLGALGSILKNSRGV
ncbi:unnamed protein product [Rhodiola kirilowii]